MSECMKCMCALKCSDQPLVCSSCGSAFHATCTSVQRTAAKLIADSVNVFFRCDDCLSGQNCGAQNSVAPIVASTDDEVKARADTSLLVDKMRSDVIAQMNNAIAQMEEELKTAFERKFDSLSGMVASKLNEIEKSLKICFGQNENLVPGNRKRVFSTRNTESDSGPTPKRKTVNLNVNNDVQMQIDNALDDEVFKSNSKQSFADVLKGKSSNIKKYKSSNRKTRPVIVIKPAESSQNCEDTRRFLKEKLNPKIHKINNFRNGKDGSIIVECALTENIENVKDGIDNDLGESYSAVIPTPARPRLKIMGMSERFSAEKFVESLKDQNDNVVINEVKVITSFENPRFRYNKYNVIIEVDKATYKGLKAVKTVKIGWDICSVYDAFGVIRCFKCGEFGHKSMNCNNLERCSKCSNFHKTSDCDTAELKCINCSKINSERKMNLETDHAAFSLYCPVYKRLLQKRKDRFDFNE